MKTIDYKGYMIPTCECYKGSGYIDLLIERYTLGRQFIKDRSVLDTCCGTGWGTFHYLSQGSKLTIGIELLKEAIDYYDFKKENFSLLQMDALQLAFGDDTFDVVFAFESIEHFSKGDAEKYIRELRRVAKPDGIIVGTTPLCADKSLIPILLDMNKYHLYVYTRRHLERLLKSYFPNVNIYEVYNKTFPYLLFFCQKGLGHEWDREVAHVVRNFINSRHDSREMKARYYRDWSTQLLARGDRVKSLKFALIALTKGPLSYGPWKSFIISSFPRWFINMLRFIKRTMRFPQIQRQPFSRVVMYERIRNYVKNLDLGGNVIVLEIGGTSDHLETKKNWFSNLERYVSVNIEKDASTDFVMDGCNLTFPANMFHVVIIDQVLEHVGNPQKMLLEAYRVLNPGGYIIVAVPFMIPIHAAPADYWRISEQGLRLLLDEVGFQDINTDSWGHKDAVFAYMKYSWPGIAGKHKLERLLKKENDKQCPLVCWSIGRKKPANQKIEP